MACCSAKDDALSTLRIQSYLLRFVLSLHLQRCRCQKPPCMSRTVRDGEHDGRRWSKTVTGCPTLSTQGTGMCRCRMVQVCVRGGLHVPNQEVGVKTCENHSKEIRLFSYSKNALSGTRNGDGECTGTGPPVFPKKTAD